MDNSKITVLVVEPLMEPYVKEIDSGLKALQKEVGGYIQVVYPFEEPVAIICNEEGKLNGEPLNRALRDEDGHVYDIVAGTFLIAGLSEDNFCSLSQAHIEQFTQEFKAPEMFARANGKILIMPMNWETVKDERPSVAEKLNVSARHNKQKQHSKSGEMEL